MRSASGPDKPFGQKFFLSSRRPSTSDGNSLRGIHINISSDPFQHRIPPYIQRLWQESKLRKRLSVWKRRLMKRYQLSGWIEIAVLATCLFSACVFLLVHVGFFSGKKYQDWQIEHYSGDTLEEVDLLDKVYPDEGRSLTTSVILLKNEQALESTVKPVLSQLCHYDMFDHYIIWNDDPDTTITIDMIHTSDCTSNKLSVVNAHAKMGSSARYHACRLSKTPYCYFQDTPRTNQKLRSTYANFLRSSYLIHGQSSNHAAFLDSQWRYCFSNTNLDLHTCYIDIESGTFVSKSAVSSFLDNYDKASVVDEYADMYFTMFMNQIPYQLEGEGSYVKELNGLELQHMNLGLTILYNDLEEGFAPLKSPAEGHVERNARAACKDDRCLFLTNKQIFPDTALFSYNPSIDVEISRQMHDDFYLKYYDEYKYTNAVDEDEQTSWKSVQNIHAGDYIGLDLLMPMRTSLKYRFLVRHPYMYASTMAIKISYDGSIWIKLHPSPSVSCQNIDGDDMQLLECRFIVTDTGYRYIQLESQKDLDFSFDVSDFSFSAKVKKDANGQLLDIAFDGVAFIDDGLI